MTSTLTPPRTSRNQTSDRSSARPSRRPSKRVIVSLIIVLAVLAGVAMWVLRFSSVTALEHVTVVGNSRVKTADILDKAQLPMGSPLLEIDAASVSSRVEDIPALSSATVSRQWPHTMVITVAERQRTVGLENPDGSYAILDATGVAFETKKSLPKGVPALSAPQGPVAQAAITVVAGLPQPLRKRVKVVAADAANNVSLGLKDGTTILWGDTNEAALKAQVATILMAKTEDKWIDVRFPMAPTSAQSSPQPAPTATPSPTASATDAAGSSTATATPVPDPQYSLSGDNQSSPTPTSSSGSTGHLVPAP